MEIKNMPDINLDEVANIAAHINRNNKIIAVYPEPAIIQIKAKTAAFHVPGVRVEGVTYTVPTFSALEGALGAIYHQKGVRTIPAAVFVHNPVKKQRMTKNSKGKSNCLNSQYSIETLQNVCYTVLVYFVQTDEMAPKASLKNHYRKYLDIAERGCGFDNAYLGLSECVMDFRPVNSIEDIKETQPYTENIGIMPFMYDYTDRYDPLLICKDIEINNGIINFTDEKEVFYVENCI